MNLGHSLSLAQENSASFKEIYDLTIDRVYSFVLLRTRDKVLALEICQDVYLALWQSLPKFRFEGEAQFYGFLFTIVRRQISKARRSINPSVTLEEVFDLPGDEEEKEDYRTLFKEIAKLGENERLVLELRYFKDLKFEDIALSLGISEGNAKVIHHRAISKLREFIPFYE